MIELVDSIQKTHCSCRNKIKQQFANQKLTSSVARQTCFICVAAMASQSQELLSSHTWLQRFPRELLWELVRHLSPSDVLMLCKTSDAFNRVVCCHHRIPIDSSPSWMNTVTTQPDLMASARLEGMHSIGTMQHEKVSLDMT